METITEYEPRTELRCIQKRPNLRQVKGKYMLRRTETIHNKLVKIVCSRPRFRTRQTHSLIKFFISQKHFYPIIVVSQHPLRTAKRSMLLWNVGQYLPDYMVQHVRRQPSPGYAQSTPSTLISLIYILIVFSHVPLGLPNDLSVSGPKRTLCIRDTQ
jgi:hypothetical protein